MLEPQQMTLIFDAGSKFNLQQWYISSMEDKFNYCQNCIGNVYVFWKEIV